MATSDDRKDKPLWLLMEENILALDSKDVADSNLEATIQKLAGELDAAGQNVSRHGGNLMQLRWAVDKMRSVGKPMLKDLNGAIAALTLEEASEPYAATTRLLDDIGTTWPELRYPDRRPEVIRAVEKARLDLLTAKAKGLPGDEGIRLLIDEKIDSQVIIGSMEITEEKLAEVKETIKKELAERERVKTLLKAVESKSDEEKAKHLFDNDVTEALIMEMMQVDQSMLDGVKKAMEEELKEKQRLAEEEAARKKAEAEGPALKDIPPEDMLGYIESIREIMEFSDVEKEIRTMCEQSSIPKSLVDIAVSDADKLDELEKEAEG
ncbi:hypothetical protein DSCO28_46450 [Desulfosarcina ovata subsp. sediminis]|uniref:Uncharacterized protein n=1 Tax=Desulfosarcina ovata subsp. sediminis TaxID=885957 RepID=A0A5K7ZV25_9BACT|nr:hypothetical protein [Desulfosarcina ovata]BBO84079.1 hypothetical protein DSCO28_46450 [Desulfosarcina ovata subsp. sediminis]